MGSFVKHMVICHTYSTRQLNDHRRRHHPLQATTAVRGPKPPSPPSPGGGGRDAATSRRWTLLAASALLSAASRGPPSAAAERWGGWSYVKERYLEPGLSPEDAAARIRQTAEGLRSMRHMLETMSWRYVLLYVRLKTAYLSADLKNAMATLPESRRPAYVKTANELVDNMAELDRYVRTPKVYESYLYYEKALESLDELVAQLA